MKSLLTWTSVLALMLIPSVANAAAVDCDDPSNASAIQMCHGYMLGVHHMYIGIAEVHDVDPAFTLPLIFTGNVVHTPSSLNYF